MTYEELLAENHRLRERIRELEQENARLKGLDAHVLYESEPPVYGLRRAMNEEVVSRTRKLREVRVVIAQQWKAQKRISAEHNHEVNLYRDAGRLTQSYPKHIVAMGVGMLLLLVI